MAVSNLPDGTERANPLRVDLEELGALMPGLNPMLFLEHGRVALAVHHRSPALFLWSGPGREVQALVAFRDPDSRSSDSLQREEFVEQGAIPMAALLLWEFERRRIKRVTKRGSRVDYFIGEQGEESYWIMEVSGMDRQRLSQRRTEKRRQLSESYHRESPECRGGYVAVTKFAPPGESVLDRVFSVGGE